jgi:hypothetical protein
MSDELFNLTPSKPSKLQQARTLLVDAELELILAEGRNCEDYAPYERAVNRFAELVKAEELAQMKGDF